MERIHQICLIHSKNVYKKYIRCNKTNAFPLFTVRNVRSSKITSIVLYNFKVHFIFCASYWKATVNQIRISNPMHYNDLSETNTHKRKVKFIVFTVGMTYAFKKNYFLSFLFFFLFWQWSEIFCIKLIAKN